MPHSVLDGLDDVTIVTAGITPRDAKPIVDRRRALLQVRNVSDAL